MKYVSIACFAVIAVNLCSPAWAGRGNALAGGWDSSLTSGNQRPASPPAPTSSQSAPPGPTVSTSLFSVGLFAGPIFSSGGGSSSNTGGAPSPEVNATLGLILVGGTVAFLRRRRIRKAEPQA